MCLIRESKYESDARHEQEYWDEKECQDRNITVTILGNQTRHVRTAE